MAVDPSSSPPATNGSSQAAQEHDPEPSRDAHAAITGADDVTTAPASQTLIDIEDSDLPPLASSNGYSALPTDVTKVDPEEETGATTPTEPILSRKKTVSF